MFPQGETLGLLQADIRSAVACHFDEEAVPGLIRLQIGTEQVVLVRLPRLDESTSIEHESPASGRRWLMPSRCSKPEASSAP